MRKETAEQKLLKLIESSDKPKSSAPPLPPETQTPPQAVTQQQEVARQVSDSVKNVGIPFFNLTLWLNFLETQLKAVMAWALPHMSFGIKEINRFLGAAIIILSLFWVMEVIVGVQSLQSEYDVSADAKIKRKNMQEVAPIPPAKDISLYLDTIQARNIFLPYEKKDNEYVAYSPGTRKIANKTEKFRLVGISWLDTPESASVMIEDTETELTYFLKQGDKIKDVTIKTIYADRVILIFEGEELAMKL